MKIRSLMILFSCLVLLVSCSMNTGSPADAYLDISSTGMAESAPDQSAFRWQIEIAGQEIKDALDSVGSTTLYDGTTQELPYHDVPKSGSVFLFLNFTVEKMRPGNSSFDWDKVAVIDENGNKYFRHENDSFLENHKYDRIPATSLKMGISTGWACFEIDSAAAQGKLYLVHQADEGDNKIQI